jgi:ElaB/YqjD/DUF883 family membrane-anchored ribosome-binding protein
VGVIQQRTGETRRAVEEFLTEAVRSGENIVQHAVGTAREYAEQAAESARKGYDEVATRVNTGLDQAQQVVRRNPMESVAVAFGAGLIAGVVTGLILKSR